MRVVGVSGGPMSGMALRDRRLVVTEVMANDGNTEVSPRGGHGVSASACGHDACAEFDGSPALLAVRADVTAMTHVSV